MAIKAIPIWIFSFSSMSNIPSVISIASAPLQSIIALSMAASSISPSMSITAFTLLMAFSDISSMTFIIFYPLVDVVDDVVDGPASVLLQEVEKNLTLHAQPGEGVAEPRRVDFGSELLELVTILLWHGQSSFFLNATKTFIPSLM